MVDTLVLRLYFDPGVRRLVRDQGKINLQILWNETVRKLRASDMREPSPALQPLEMHRKIVEGLPGETLFICSAMAFDSMNEALQLFDVSPKTAKQRIGNRLSTSESEIARVSAVC